MTSAKLAGDLAGELTAVLRSQLELTTLRRAPQRRELLRDVALLAAGGIAALLAAGAATLALALLLTKVLVPWAAALAAAGTWLVAAALVLRGDRARRVLEAVTPPADDAALAAAEQELAVRLDALQVTARALAASVEHDVIEHERQAVESALRELLAAVLAPARAVLRR